MVMMTGAGALSTGVSTLTIIYFGLSDGYSWARYALLVTNLCWYIPTFVSTVKINLQTKSRYGYANIALGIICIAAGWFLSDEADLPYDSFSFSRF